MQDYELDREKLYFAKMTDKIITEKLNIKNDIELVVPASSLEEMKFYIDNDASEIYFGIRLDGGKKHLSVINKRYEKSGNFMSYEIFDELKKIDKKNTKLSLVLNNNFIIDEIMDAVEKQIVASRDVVDAYIVSDLALIEKVKKFAPGKEIVLSVIAACMNDAGVDMYRKLGIKRIVLTRHMTFEEYGSVVRNNPDMEFEVMIINQFCRNVDGFCSRCHIPKGDKHIMTCDLEFNAKPVLLDEDLDVELVTKAKKNIEGVSNLLMSCGICFIPKLINQGVKILKLVGRNGTFEDKKNDFILVKKALELLESSSDVKNYEDNCISSYRKIKGYDCDYNCYFR